MAQEQEQLGLLPNPPQDTDVMGNETPAAMANPAQPGADTLANPSVAPENTGRFPLSPVSGGASIMQRMSAQNSPHLKAFTSAIKNAIQSNPKAATQPGVLSRLLVGGAIEALGGSLGDAAAAGTPAPGGGGALTGIARTMQARGQRQAAEREEVSKEKTQEALRAETTMRIAAATRNMYRQDVEDRKAAHTEGNTFMSTLRKDNETQEDKDNVTQDQLNEMMKKDPNFWKTHTGRAVGEEPILDGNGNPTKDKDGNPVVSPLYAISKVNGARNHKITADESKFIEKNTGEKLPADTELGLHQYDNVMVRASSANTAKRAIEKANDEDLADEKAHQLNTDLNDMNIQHYMFMVPGEPLTGLYQAKQNAQAHLASLDQMIAAGQQKGGQTDTLQALQSKRQGFADQSKKIDNVLSSFNGKAQEDYVKMIDERRKQTEIERHNKAEEGNKARENEIKAALNDPDALAPLLVDGEMDPSQLSKRSSTYNAQLASANAYSMKKYGKPYDIAQAQTDYKFANRGDTQNTLKYLNSLTGGTDPSKGNLSELVNRSNGIARTEFPALNDAAAWARLQTGDPGIVGYRTTVTEVADQVAKILQGGGTGNGTSDAKLKQAQELFDKGFTKGQIMEAANALRPLLSNRRDSMIGDNKYLIRQFGKSSGIPTGAANQTAGKAANGTPVWKMSDGSIQDATGKKYDPQTGQPQ